MINISRSSDITNSSTYSDISKSQLLEWILEIINIEKDGLSQLAESLNDEVLNATQLILECKSRVILIGIGKSGHICKKISATLSSTGTPSLFVHPSEASHGDLGMIKNTDVVICMSKSGESRELFDSLNYCRRFSIPLIGITENKESSVGKAADITITLPKVKEACPHNLAPSTSTTMMLALGDALALSCLKARQFSPEHFKSFHPGGKLGNKLLRAVEVVNRNNSLPIVNYEATIKEAILVMTNGRNGCVGIINSQGELVGIYTDGDLRRQISNYSLDHPLNDLMCRSPQKVSPETLLSDVAKLFSTFRIPSVFVCSENKPIGIVHVHDLLQQGVI